MAEERTMHGGDSKDTATLGWNPYVLLKHLMGLFLPDLRTQDMLLKRPGDSSFD